MEFAHMSLVKVRLLRPFRVYKRGDVIDLPGGMADAWIRTNLAVLEPQQELIETASLEPEQKTRTADVAPRRRRGH